MKKLFALILLTVSGATFAHGNWHHGYWNRGPGGFYWVAPTVIGGVIGYEIARSQSPVIVQNTPVVIPNPPVVVTPQQSCSPWTETQNLDGTITRTRTCTQ